MSKMVVVLEEADMVELQTILLDDDEGAALAFLKERVAARLPSKGSSPCDSTRLNPYLMPRE